MYYHTLESAKVTNVTLRFYLGYNLDSAKGPKE